MHEGERASYLGRFVASCWGRVGPWGSQRSGRLGYNS